MKFIKRILPHLTIILAFMTLTFFCIDRVNSAMAFMTSEMSKWLFMALALLAILTSILAIGGQWKEDAREAKRELKQHAKTRKQAERLFENHEALPEEEESEEESEEEEKTAGEKETEEERDTGTLTEKASEESQEE